MRSFSARLIILIHHSTLYGRTNRVRWRTKGKIDVYKFFHLAWKHSNPMLKCPPFLRLIQSHDLVPKMALFSGFRGDSAFRRLSNGRGRGPLPHRIEKLVAGYLINTTSSDRIVSLIAD